MDKYADGLRKALVIAISNKIIINDYIPSIPAWLKKLKVPFALKIRFARYIIYPYLAKRIDG